MAHLYGLSIYEPRKYFLLFKLTTVVEAEMHCGESESLNDGIVVEKVFDGLEENPGALHDAFGDDVADEEDHDHPKGGPLFAEVVKTSTMECRHFPVEVAHGPKHDWNNLTISDIQLSRQSDAN